MLLTNEERQMLDGAQGPGIQRAMELLVKLGESFDAEKFVPITYGHVSYDFSPEEFWDLMTEGVGQTDHRVTTHPSFSPEVWKEKGLSLADRWIGEHERKLKRFKELGWLRTETCAEYLLGIVPRKGDIVSMGGSCMQVANNSLFGGTSGSHGDSSFPGSRSDRSNAVDGTAPAGKQGGKSCGRTG